MQEREKHKGRQSSDSIFFLIFFLKSLSSGWFRSGFLLFLPAFGVLVHRGCFADCSVLKLWRSKEVVC
ncbi:hypothetical protein V6N11_024732 [Hibiscus sabdariffa]|uniref:Uncharacterized protein n=1 Tax=Hibiscus sabdariffa TaxID=183260 RepID=A0ABR2QN00_9ROSI